VVSRDLIEAGASVLRGDARHGCGGVVTVMAWARAWRGKVVGLSDDRGEVGEPLFEYQVEGVLEASWVVRRRRRRCA